MILFLNKKEACELRCIVAGEMRRKKVGLTAADRINSERIVLLEKLIKKLNKGDSK